MLPKKNPSPVAPREMDILIIQTQNKRRYQSNEPPRRDIPSRPDNK